MKVTIINDAAWVGLEIAKSLESLGIEVKYLPRGRSIYGKTVGVFANALRSSGIKHVNYALQDAFALRMVGKRIHILHCHGTDLFGILDETFMKESKDLSRWEWMIKGNLKSAGKVIVSTADLLPLARRIRPDAEYVPNPIDTVRFSPRSLRNKKLRAIGFDLWYERVPKALVNKLMVAGVAVDIYSRRPFAYSEIHKILQQYDIYIDRMSVLSLSKTCLEAMSCGLVTIDYRHRDDLERRIDTVLDPSKRKSEGMENRDFILESHDSKKVATRLIQLYEEVS